MTSPQATELADDNAASGVLLVRRRVLLAFGAMFVVAVSSAGPAIAGTDASQAADLMRQWPRLLLLATALPMLMAVFARLIIRPVEELGRTREQLLELYDQARLDARIDPLTGLGNHRAFQEELGRQVAESQRSSQPVSLVFIDIDDLKGVNDESGHAGGDELLSCLGRLATVTARSSDRPFRIGGDEFAILLPGSDSTSAYALTRRMLARALEGDPSNGSSRRFSFSAGISTFPLPSSDALHLSRQADAALYWAKRHGRTDIQVFDPARHGAAGDPRSTLELAEAVRAVAAYRDLRPVYQPIFSLSSGRAIAFEGLVRPKPGSGFRDAESLFVAAELADRIVELDAAALDVVIGNAGRIEAGQYLSVNLSPRTLETEQFRVGDLLAILARHDLAATQVVLELTERGTIEDMARLQANLGACRAAGFRIAADDVGAGNAGLRLLSEIAFDIIKIDLSLVQRGALRDSALVVLKAIRDIADRCGATVVAEGVESPEQLAAVRELGVAAGQGYLLGRPSERMSAEAVDLGAMLALAEAHDEAMAS